MTLISKAQLLERTRISANLTDRQVIPFIEDAEEYDLPTLLNPGLIADVQAIDITATAWNNATTYIAGVYVTHKGFYYKALGASMNVEPGTNPVVWEADAKATLRYNWLPDFLIWSTMRWLLIEHGRNITEAGLTNPTDPEATYTPSSDKARAELAQRATDRANFHRARINEFLSKNGLIQTTPCITKATGYSGRINAI